MLYREAGQFKASYAEDQQIFAIRQDRIAVGDACVYDIWISPRTGDDVSRCPWLRKVPGSDKYTCRIHDVKPDRCRQYPLSRRHAEETGCKGFDSVRSRGSQQH